MQSQKDVIYFVEEIIPNFKADTKEPINYTVILLKTTLELTIRFNEENINFVYVLVGVKELSFIKEGAYVYYNESDEDNVQFLNANQNRIAKRNVYWNNTYRGELIKKIPEKIELPIIQEDVKVFSYHVNVGHGNCSIIVIEDINGIHLWMVDCSNRDFRSGIMYQTNINDCFAHIINKFKIEEIILERFFLTHSHYDHYSGIPTLISNGIITNQTNVFINPHYSMPGITHTRIIENIKTLGCPIIEPIISSNQNGLEFWHPHIRTVRVRTAKYENDIVDEQSNPNNSSAVFKLTIGRKSILFTGDIETIRWNTIEACPCFIDAGDYFVISHHGSKSGHLRTHCPRVIGITNVSQCTSSQTRAILMGRDGAFNGIYSPEVIHDFMPDLVYSEMDQDRNPSRFLEINWELNQNTWY